MPGIRFGYGVAAEELIEKLQTVRQPWSINSLASFATSAAFNDTEFIENTRRTIKRERTRFSEMLSGIDGLHVFPSETDFLLVKIMDKRMTSTALKEKMAEEGILIRDCCTFVGLDDSYFRVTVRSARTNLKLVKTLAEVLSRVK
jgi:threonine-phosphate decarboxylase